MKVLLIDAFDSFIHIIDLYLKELGCETTVRRSDTISATEIEGLSDELDLVVLGPGPGAPEDSGHVQIVCRLAGRVPLFGVCLGHQAIGVAFGRRVERATPVHGGTSLLDVEADPLFHGVTEPTRVTRYHSLVVAGGSDEHLRVVARSRDDGHIMAMRHQQLPVWSVQFHPESVLTVDGLRLMDNVLTRAAAWRGSRERAA